jgi:transcription termination factor Rho
MSANFDRLYSLTRDELLQEALSAGVDDAPKRRRSDLVFAVAQIEAGKRNIALGRGILEVHGEGFGFLRSPQDNYLPGNNDIYVSQSQIRRFKLQTGDTVVGVVRPPKEGERYPALLRVERVNGEPTGTRGPIFESLTAIYPDDRIPLSHDPYLRPVDMVSPIGLGQRGILVAGPRTGKVELLRHLAALFLQDEELEVTVLLVGERPEEIHDWRTNTSAEVIATPFDEPTDRHIQVTDIVFERARRMVERGDDVVLLVDSLSRLLRFCLAELPPSGRDVQGVDTAALHRIRRYLGAARALEEGGSLTVVGVISGDDNRTNQVLLDDLRDVVNWELVLAREIADRGIRPPIDIHRSGTRREERLLEPQDMDRRAQWRSSLSGDAIEDATALITMLANPSLLDSVAKSGQ